MSSEFDLSTDLATIQARLNGAFDGIHEILEPSQCTLPSLEEQLKEQTQQIKQMAEMMKSMMSLAVPLLEEQAHTLQQKKVRKQYKQVMDDLKGCMGGKQMRLKRTYICCSVPFCNYIITAGVYGDHDEIICADGHRYSLSNQRFYDDKEKLILEKFLCRHRQMVLYEHEKKNIPYSKLSPERKAFHDKEARELYAKKFMESIMTKH